MEERDPAVMLRARDFYSVYCASSDGKNYQGLPCPAWDALTEAVRGHWYTVALRSLELAARARDAGAENDAPPGARTLGHLEAPVHALDVWQRYSRNA